MVKICSLLCIDVYGCKKPCKHDFTTNESFEPGFFMQNFYPSELAGFMWIFMHADFIALFLLSKKNVMKKAHGDNNPFQKKVRNKNKQQHTQEIYMYICIYMHQLIQSDLLIS